VTHSYEDWDVSNTCRLILSEFIKNTAVAVVVLVVAVEVLVLVVIVGVTVELLIAEVALI
jgi:hypothetical protein